MNHRVNDVIDAVIDDGYKKHIAWENTIQGNDTYAFLWNPKRLCVLQTKITELLAGVEPSGRPIIVPVDKIGHVLSQVYASNRPNTGDIYSRFTLPGIEGNRDDVTEIVDRTINIIVSQIRNEYEITRCNNNLTVWNTVYGDFNKEGLRAHAPIKIRKRRSERMQFNMNY